MIVLNERAYVRLKLSTPCFFAVNLFFFYSVTPKHVGAVLM